MKHVTQRGGGDCGVACVAMLAGVPYSEAYAAFIDNPEPGTLYPQIRTALRNLNVPFKEPRRVRCDGAGKWTPGTMYWWRDKTALVAVWVDLRSASNFLEPHWIAVHGGRVYDGRRSSPYRYVGYWPAQLYPTSYMEVMR